VQVLAFIATAGSGAAAWHCRQKEKKISECGTNLARNAGVCRWAILKDNSIKSAFQNSSAALIN
jgi:hypothetical protein